MRPFACLFALSLVSVGCRLEDDIHVALARSELVEIVLPQPGERLLYVLPDAGWRRIEEMPFRGFLYGKDGRSLRVSIFLKEDRFEDAAARVAAVSEEIRSFSVGRAWPFVGIILTYRGPPDAQLLDAFVMSFRVERR